MFSKEAGKEMTLRVIPSIFSRLGIRGTDQVHNAKCDWSLELCCRKSESSPSSPITSYHKWFIFMGARTISATNCWTCFRPSIPTATLSAGSPLRSLWPLAWIQRPLPMLWRFPYLETSPQCLGWWHNWPHQTSWCPFQTPPPTKKNMAVLVTIWRQPTHPYHILKRAARSIGTTTFLPQQGRGKVFHFTARPLEQQTSGQILLEESLEPQ